MSRKDNTKKKKTAGDYILTLVLIAAICVFCYAAFNLYHIYMEYKKGTDEYNSISEMAVTERDPDEVEELGQPDEQPTAPISIDFSSLKSINDDVIGETGRRVRLRILCPRRGGSSPLIRTTDNVN